MVDDGKDRKPNRYGKILSRLCLMSLLLTEGVLSANTPSIPFSAYPMTITSTELIKKLEQLGISPDVIDEKLKQSKCITLHPVCAKPVRATPVWAQKQTCKPCLRKPIEPAEPKSPELTESKTEQEIEQKTEQEAEQEIESVPEPVIPGQPRLFAPQQSGYNPPMQQRPYAPPQPGYNPPMQQRPFAPQQPGYNSLMPQRPFTPQQPGYNPQMQQGSFTPQQPGYNSPMPQRPFTSPQPGFPQPMPQPMLPQRPMPSGFPQSILPPPMPQPMPFTPRQSGFIPPIQPRPITPGFVPPIQPRPVAPALARPFAPVSRHIPTPTPLTARLGQIPPKSNTKPIPVAKPVINPTRAAAVKAPATKRPIPVVAKPAVAFVKPSLPTVLHPDAKAKTLKEALKNLALTSGFLNLAKPETVPMAKPDVPPVIRPRPYGVIPTSSPFYLPEKPPEGHSPLAKEIAAHLKKRPPAYEPDEVIAEDPEIIDPKER